MIVGLNEHPDVVAVIPTLGNKPARLEACVSAVRASAFSGNLAIVVVWNDPRVPLEPLPGVIYLQPQMNLGFPGALNYARAHFESQALWVMQDDVTVTASCLSALWDNLQGSAQLAAVTPVLINEAGLVPALTRAGVIADDGTMDHWYPVEDTAPEDIDRDYPFNWISTSAALIRLSAWDRVGGYDPEYFPLQWADVDFGYRLTRAGFDLAIEPGAHIGHEIGGSTPYVLSQYLSHVNPERFRLKHTVGLAPDVASDVPPDLQSKIAKAASLGFVDIARFASTVYRDRAHESTVYKAEAERLAGEAEGLTADLTRAGAHIVFLDNQLAEHAAKIEALQLLSAEREGELANVKEVLAERERELAGLQQTLSWRITRPLRWVRSLR